jgi:hypothetical protein
MIFRIVHVPLRGGALKDPNQPLPDFSGERFRCSPRILPAGEKG